MSFNTTKWNKFLIGEAEQAEVDRFLDRLSRTKPSEAPFDNIFKGKWRIAMDYSPKEFEYMRAIDARMEELGHEIEHVGTVGWMVTRKQDRDAWEKRSNMLYTAWIQATDDAEAESGIDTSSFAGQGDLISWADENPDNPEAKKYNEVFGQYRRHDKRGIRKTKLGKVVAREFKDNREIVDSWNKSARIYQDDPNIFKVAKAAENYSMIISRHPIDVYRMSDHAGITSCHSLDSSHSQCATQEAEDIQEKLVTSTSSPGPISLVAKENTKASVALAQVTAYFLPDIFLRVSAFSNSPSLLSGSLFIAHSLNTLKSSS